MPGSPTRAGEEQGGACSHLYTTASGPDGYLLTIRIHYDVRWTATGFPGGDLGDLVSQPFRTTVIVKGTQAVGRR